MNTRSNSKVSLGRRDLIAALLALLHGSAAFAQQTELNGIRNGGPGVIVMSPVADQNQNHLRLSATFLVTGDIAAGSRLVAVATLPSGQKVVLRDFSPQPASALCSPCSTDGRRGPLPCCQPTSYPLTDVNLPAHSLPVGTSVTVTLVQPARPATTASRFLVRTTPVIRGVVQSADRMILEIIGGFNSKSPAFVYFGLWPYPVRSEAVSIHADRIVLDLRKDPITVRRASDLYPVTVYQPGRVCDTILVNFHSPLGRPASQNTVSPAQPY